MKKLKSVEEIGEKQKVILRMDLDLPINGGEIVDVSRLKKSVPTIRLLLEKGCKVAIIGHRDRPEGTDPNLSLKPVYLELMAILEGDGEQAIENVFVDEFLAKDKIEGAVVNNQIVFFENLRYFEGEIKNDPGFLMNLVGISDAFVNDAVAVAHRRHASVMLHESLPAFYGLNFVEEIERLSRLKEEPDRPMIIILGGAKEDKANYLPRLAKLADKVLVGGKLPMLVKEPGEKVVVGKLKENGLDIDNETIEKFVAEIKQARTVVWVGTMGQFEVMENRDGTNKIAFGLAESEGYKVVAGGDTGAAVEKLGLKEKIDFVASGGGVVLEFLTREKLPAWE